MKLMISGVVFSAAMVKSPSFSRSSSSTTTTMRPARNSSRTSGTGEKGILLIVVCAGGFVLFGGKQFGDAHSFATVFKRDRVGFGEKLDKAVAGWRRLAMHNEHSPVQIQNPILRDSGGGVDYGFAGQIEGGGEIGDFNGQ